MITRRECFIGGGSFLVGASAMRLGTGFAARLGSARQVSPDSTVIGRSIVKIIIAEEPSGAGTGFCIATSLEPGSCIIATASHVVDGKRINDLADKPNATSILANDGSTDMIRSSWSHEGWMDVCGFRTQLPLQPLLLADDLPAVGETIYAIGFANGGPYEIRKGIFTGLSLNGTTRLVTTAKISPGFSGGPILNTRGQVIGMSVTLSFVEDLSRSVPLHELRNLLERMRFIERWSEANKPEMTDKTGSK